MLVVDYLIWCKEKKEVSLNQLSVINMDQIGVKTETCYHLKMAVSVNKIYNSKEKETELQFFFS